MTGIDCNILVRLALADHPANADTLAAVQAEVATGNKLVFRQSNLAEIAHATKLT